jgi:putative chitinase
MASPIAPITLAPLKTVFPEADDADLQAIADELNRDPAAYGLDTNLRRAHFLAQVRQEVGPGISQLSENLNYKAETLVAKFGYYKTRAAEAAADAYLRDASGRIVRKANQEAIANKAYGGRIGNGPPASGDGWRYRGRGCIQVTGRDNYRAISETCRQLYPGMDVDFVAHPDLMADLPGAVRSAVGFWIRNNCHRAADRGSAATDVDRVTAIVNKHTDSYKARQANFVIARRAFP